MELAVAQEFGDDPFREWEVDGEEWYALSPAFLAAGRQLQREGVEAADIREQARRVNEWRSGRRRPSMDVLEEMRDFDAQQRANGYTGP